MTDRPAVDRLVTDWLRDAAPAHASEGTLAVAMERVADSGQERHVTQRLFGDELGRSTGLRRSLALGLVALGLIGAVAVAGALIPRPPAPTGTPSNGWVAYSVAGDIVIARPGEAPRVVISQEGDAIDQTCPRFSPDGASLAYIEQPAFAQEGDPRNIVFTGGVVDESTGLARRVPTSSLPVGGSLPDGCPAWSPDGRHLAMLGSGRNLELVVFDLDGSGTVRFQRDDAGADPDATPIQAATFAWSPDGSRLAVLIGFWPGTSELWIVPTDAGEPRRILAGAPDLEIFRSIAWSPDGSEIAYRGHTYTENQEGAPETPRRHFVRRIAVDGASAPVELDTWTETKDVSSAGPAWSPDGGRMAYERNGEIVVGSADGSASRPLPTVRLVPPEDDPWEADGTWWPGALSWSPDGRRLISLGTSMPFLDRGVASSIVSVDADGVGAPEILTPWRLAYYADRAPSWQPVLETVPAWDPDARGVDDLGPLATRAPNPVPTPTPPPQPASDE
jgi:Tol biopolymer transport system component